MISFNIRSAGYVVGKNVLKNLSGEIEDHTTTMIIGRSGGGKTTLILTLTGILTNLLEGWVDGEIILKQLDPLDPEDFKSIPKIVGAVLQDPDKQISMPTPWDEISFVLENLGYPPEEIDRRVSQMLREAGLEHKAFHEIEKLSGGEKRRVTYAASVAHDPEIIILDEPTASVDPWGIKTLRDFVRRYRGEKTIVIIEHKPDYFIDYVDKIIRIENGMIKEVYKPSERDHLEKKFSEYDRDLPSMSKTVSNNKILETKDLVIGYDKPILKDISIELYEKEIVVITGANGSGKTTLMKTLIGWLKPFDGEIKIYGRPMRKRKDLLKTFFYISQQPDYMFLSNTVENELRSGRGLSEDLFNMFPWKNILKENPYKISFGQRRWLSILLGLVYQRKILMIDEPSAGLDPDLYKDLVRFLMSLVDKYNISLIISTHDPRIIRDLAHRVYHIDHVKNKIMEIDKEKILKMMYEAAMS